MNYEIVMHGEEFALIDGLENVLHVGTEEECLLTFKDLVGDAFIPTYVAEALDKIEEELCCVG
jgi:hypothetical protein